MTIQILAVVSMFIGVILGYMMGYMRGIDVAWKDAHSAYKDIYGIGKE